MTITKDTIQDMMARGLEQYSVEELLPCKNYAEQQEKKGKDVAKSWGTVKDKFSEAIENHMSDGEQLSFEIDGESWGIDKQIVEELSFDIPEEDLILLSQSKGYTNFIKTSFKTLDAKRAYIKGTLPSDLSSHVVTQSQVKMKYSKPKKGKNTNGS